MSEEKVAAVEARLIAFEERWKEMREADGEAVKIQASAYPTREDIAREMQALRGEIKEAAWAAAIAARSEADRVLSQLRTALVTFVSVGGLAVTGYVVFR